MDLGKVREFFDEIDAKNGIGEELYLAISQLTPSVNVDLIIKSPDLKSTLLTWRHDEFYGPGWHVPGGVIRFKEKMLDRVHKVADGELGCKVKVNSEPIGYHEMFNHTRDVRGHFVCFVFQVELYDSPSLAKFAGENPENGQCRWFSSCPDNLIPNQAALRKYI